MPAIAAPLQSEADSDASAIALRPSTELMVVPPERVPAPRKPAVADPPPSILLASLNRFEPELPAAVHLPRRLVPAPPPEVTWAFASLALAAGVGWLYERRCRVRLEADGIAGHWISTPPASLPRHGVNDTFSEGREIVEAAQPVYVAVIGDTPSRREATLVHLHDLQDRLETLRGRRDFAAAAQLLEQHLVDFRYSSPWVFLELRELYLKLDRREEWRLVREAFRNRFGQNAPHWNSASTATAELADDQQLRGDLLRKWPQREARLFILRWMLGDAQSRQKSVGPPQLALGVYRDMLLLDTILDHVIAVRPKAAPVLVGQV